MTPQVNASRLRFHGWLGDLLNLLGGALVPLSLAPWDQWYVGLLACGFLAISLQGLSPGRAWLRSLSFGLGMYTTGVSWVYISIHDFGMAPPLLAGIMTAAFVSFIALVFSVPFYFYQRFVKNSQWGLLLGFPAIWVLGEWSRSWFLTGFPWLYTGYAHLDTWLAGWAPITGVFGLSFLNVFTGVALLRLLDPINRFITRKRPLTGIRPSSLALLVAAVCWLTGFALQDMTWTTPRDDGKRSVAIVQPNIPLELKWNPFYQRPIMRKLQELTEKQWQNDLIVWPEAAVPLMYHEAEDFLTDMGQQASTHNTALVTGILYDDKKPNTYYNSIIGIGNADRIYFKQRLVPFGEYVPLEKYLRGLIAFFDLPNSVIFPGPKNQKGLSVDDYQISPSICYEVVYPDLVAKNLADAELMITISNDAWFGTSIGPLQHFEMARMRALENGRYMIRGTNTGLSGIISHKGVVETKGNQFLEQTIVGTVYLMQGQTPFNRTGSTPLIILCLGILAVTGLKKRAAL